MCSELFVGALLLCLVQFGGGPNLTKDPCVHTLKTHGSFVRFGKALGEHFGDIFGANQTKISINISIKPPKATLDPIWTPH